MSCRAPALVLVKAIFSYQLALEACMIPPCRTALRFTPSKLFFTRQPPCSSQSGWRGTYCIETGKQRRRCACRTVRRKPPRSRTAEHGLSPLRHGCRGVSLRCRRFSGGAYPGSLDASQRRAKEPAASLPFANCGVGRPLGRFEPSLVGFHCRRTACSTIE